MKFTKQAWEKASPIYQSILKLPFITELAEGTLRQDRFSFYLEQDSLYLIDFAKALALIASKAREVDDFVNFLQFSKEAILAERGMHATFFKEMDLIPTKDKSPACFAYTHFLLSNTSFSSYEAALAGLLPCFWIYREVGNYIFKICKKNNPYEKWIQLYSSPEFSLLVDKALEITDRLASTAGEIAKEEMTKAFLFSSKLEWMFWDDAYHLRKMRLDS